MFEDDKVSEFLTQSIASYFADAEDEIELSRRYAYIISQAEVYLVKFMNNIIDNG